MDMSHYGVTHILKATAATSSTELNVLSHDNRGYQEHKNIFRNKNNGTFTTLHQTPHYPSPQFTLPIHPVLALLLRQSVMLWGASHQQSQSYA